MREKVARWLRTYKLNEVEVDDPTDDGIVPWDESSQQTRVYWLRDADKILTLIRVEIEEVENPSPEGGLASFYFRGFERCRHAILEALE